MVNVLKHFAIFESGKRYTFAAFVVAVLVCAPLLSLMFEAVQGSIGHWGHLLTYVLPHALWNTILLLLGVGFVVTFLGTGAAWLVTAYDYPGRRFLTWALLLPLAVPTYIIAFTYLDILHPIGPIQGLIRDVLGYSSPREFRLPDIRGLWGAILLMGVVLYPYVYLTTRFMFLTQAASVVEAARVLGETPRGVFLRVALPLARPAIAVGVTLALLETLNDVGAAEFLGVKTLTLAIYTTWVTRSDLAGAAQIALSMLFIIVFLLHFEKRARQRQRYSLVQRMRPMTPTVLKGRHIALAWVLGVIPIAFGFLLPAGYLVVQVFKRMGQQTGFSTSLIQASFNTLTIASVATVLTVTLGLIVAWAARRVRDSANEQSLGKLFSRLASLGYAVPGTVLAIGLLGPLLLIDQGIEWVLGLAQYKVTTLIVLGSTAGLLMAYVIRFLAIANGSIEAGLARIPPSIEQASRLLGESSSRTLWRVHIPLLKPAMISAALLVFVDTMKELPATLMLRPINFETLATLLYGEASRGMYEEGAVAALMIVLLGLLPVILLARAQQRSV